MINVTHRKYDLCPKCNVFKGEKIDNEFDNDINKGDFSYYTVDEILYKCLCVCCYTFSM